MYRASSARVSSDVRRSMWANFLAVVFGASPPPQQGSFIDKEEFDNLVSTHTPVLKEMEADDQVGHFLPVAAITRLWQVRIRFRNLNPIKTELSCFSFDFPIDQERLIGSIFEVLREAFLNLPHFEMYIVRPRGRDLYHIYTGDTIACSQIAKRRRADSFGVVKVLETDAVKKMKTEAIDKMLDMDDWNSQVTETLLEFNDALTEFAKKLGVQDPDEHVVPVKPKAVKPQAQKPQAKKSGTVPESLHSFVGEWDKIPMLVDSDDQPLVKSAKSDKQVDSDDEPLVKSAKSDKQVDSDDEPLLKPTRSAYEERMRALELTAQAKLDEIDCLDADEATVYMMRSMILEDLEKAKSELARR
jgi:hypothetical protein